MYNPASLVFQRVVDKDGNVISQLCDDEGNLGQEEFEKAMRKQAEQREILGQT
jgi:hypothetical protein